MKEIISTYNNKGELIRRVINKCEWTMHDTDTTGTDHNGNVVVYTIVK